MEELPIHLFLQVNEKHPPFAWALTPILQDRKHRRSKSKHSPDSYLKINVILAWAAKWWSWLSVTRVVNALIRSDKLYCPLTNQMLPWLEQLKQQARDREKLLQSPNFYCPFTPRLLTPPPPPTGILYFPQFCSHQETKMAAHWTQWSTSTISQKNWRLWTV